MSCYYVNQNAQSNGDHEVHVTGCTRMPEPQNRKYLGEFTSCAPAVREAKKTYARANGCFYCCRPCHTS
ncbi:hypothetical protein [Aurantivibrio plasticivorans]